MEALLAILLFVVVVFILVSKNKPEQDVTSKEQSLEESIRKFQSLGVKKIESMTADELAVEIGTTRRAALTRLARHKMKCKDFDFTMGMEEKEIGRAHV